MNEIGPNSHEPPIFDSTWSSLHNTNVDVIHNAIVDITATAAEIVFEKIMDQK